MVGPTGGGLPGPGGPPPAAGAPAGGGADNGAVERLRRAKLKLQRAANQAANIGGLSKPDSGLARKAASAGYGVLKTASPATALTLEGALVAIPKALNTSQEIPYAKFVTAADRGSSSLTSSAGRYAAAQELLTPGGQAHSKRLGREALTVAAGDSHKAVGAFAKKLGYRNYQDSFGIAPAVARQIAALPAIVSFARGDFMGENFDKRAAAALPIIGLAINQLASVVHSAAGANNAANANDLLASSSTFVSRGGAETPAKPNATGNAFRPFIAMLAVGNTTIEAAKAAMQIAIHASDLDDQKKAGLLAGVEVAAQLSFYGVGAEAAHHTVRNIAAAAAEQGKSLQEPLRDENGAQIGDIISHKAPVARVVEGVQMLEFAKIDVPVHNQPGPMKPRNSQVEIRTISVLNSSDGSTPTLAVFPEDQENGAGARNMMSAKMRDPGVDSQARGPGEATYKRNPIARLGDNVAAGLGQLANGNAGTARKTLSLVSSTTLGAPALRAAAGLGEAAKAKALEMGLSEFGASRVANAANAALNHVNLGEGFVPGFQTFATPTEGPDAVSPGVVGASIATPVVGGRLAIASGAVDVNGPRLDRTTFAPYVVNKTLAMDVLSRAPDLRIVDGGAGLSVTHAIATPERMNEPNTAKWTPNAAFVTELADAAKGFIPPN